MRPIAALSVYVIVVFIGGALLAPWLYWAAQTIAPGSHLAQNPFHRFVDRSFLAMALIGIWPLLRALGATSLREVGLVKPAGQARLFLAGFAIGFGSLAAAAFITIAAHERQFNSALGAGQIASGIAAAIGTALVVAVLEEILFRGAIFGGLRRFWDWRIALIISSMVYAIVHFLQKVDLAGPIVWSSGLRLLPQKLHGFEEWNALVPCFFNLTFVGMLLGLAYQRTGNLYCSIGMHAGWIFWLRAYAMLTTPIHDNVHTAFWGSQKLIDGWLALCVLALPLFIIILMPQRKTRLATA
ncbi:MAG TPA: type II CAAX endopeptidase family protein [Verrucomicrobiae bacterium]|nr:type II CAAX endopeptidase family protein [Verrucomicrobiae bacterium]